MKLRNRSFASTSITVSLFCVACVAACGSDQPSSSPGGAGSPSASGAAGAAPVTAGAGGGGSPGAAGSATAGGSSGASAGSGGVVSGGASTGGASTGGASTGGASTGGASIGGASIGGAAGAGGSASKTTFFVTSDTSMTGNLGGLSGADARCQKLAVAAGFGAHAFHAYLSAEKDPADASKAVNARDRIGTGPWYNSKGVLLAQDLATLHALNGNAELFLDEKGMKINGQWAGSPTPNEHDVLTGSDAMGKVLVGKTCADWTSTGITTAMVGHADGLGPGASSTPPYNSWNSSHENGSCGDTAPKGGAGRLYCFAIN